MFPFAMQCFFLINKRFFFVSFYFFFYIVHLYTSVNVCPFKKYIYGRPNNKQSAKNQSSIPITKDGGTLPGTHLPKNKYIFSINYNRYLIGYRSWRS